MTLTGEQKLVPKTIFRMSTGNPSVLLERGLIENVRPSRERMEEVPAQHI